MSIGVECQYVTLKSMLRDKVQDRLVERFATKIAESSQGLPILDVACGSGRNALPFYQLGCQVICVDKDLSDLKAQLLPLLPRVSAREAARIELREIDLLKECWPFEMRSIGGIINIHFFCAALLPLFERSLVPQAYLLFETVPGCGGNYVELPREGAVRESLTNGFCFEFYKERRVGPKDRDAVTVQLLARRR